MDEKEPTDEDEDLWDDEALNKFQEGDKVLNKIKDNVDEEEKAITNDDKVLTSSEIN